MKISVIKKQKGRVYKSADMVLKLFGKVLLHDEKGAPQIDGEYISISDTSGYWACAISNVPLGLDLEEAGRKVSPTTVRRLHPTEQEYLAGLSEGSSEWREEFLSVWVRKEAYMKLKGVGIQLGLSSFSVVDTGLAKDFMYGQLHVGIAGDFEYEISGAEYDAPFITNCMECAASMLDSHMHSSAEITKKLKDKGYPSEEITQTVKKLKEYGYIDDMSYAEIYARKLAAKGYAKRRIEQELIKKGIDKELAKEASSALESSPYEDALSIASSMKLRDEKDLARIGRKLASLGYETSLIYDILSKLKYNLKDNIEG